MSATTLGANLGTPPGLGRMGTPVAISGMAIQHYSGGSGLVLTEFQFDSMALSITDALAYSSLLIHTMPKGKIKVLSSASYLIFTTTSAIASTLNSGVTVQYGFGSAAASATTLATTMINFLAGTGQTVPTFTSSTTINVAPAAVTHHDLAALVPIDGSSTALPVYFNLAVGTGTDIDADATLTVTGRWLLLWANMGGYAYYPANIV
jgi:hypothetical protein